MSIKLLKYLNKSRIILKFCRPTVIQNYIRHYGSRNILKLSDRGIWSSRFPSTGNEFEQSLISKPQTAYSGFDPTGNSLHIGHLLVLNALLHFQRYGHHVIILIGGATGKIGDPSGKNKERPLLDKETIDSNCEAISLQVKKIFENHEYFIWNKIKSDRQLHPIRVKNNLEWFENVPLIDFLRKAGKHVSVNVLLKKVSIQSRLDEQKHLSFTEFTYQILQAWDWYILYKKYGCSIQIGGNDQFGNILSGYDLINAKDNEAQVTGLMVPLLKSETGDKLGKSSGSPVWLCPKQTSPFDFYQSFMRIKDSEVEMYLKLLTFIPLSEIETVMKLHVTRSNETLPQKKLAEQVTLLIHGEEGLKAAKRGTQILYGGDHSVLAEMSSDEVKSLFKNSAFSSHILVQGMTLLDLAMNAKCFHSEAKAIHIIENGGFYINQARVTNPNLVLIPGVHILPNNLCLMRVGKRNYYIVDFGHTSS